jgi:hypothetical protein
MGLEVTVSGGADGQLRERGSHEPDISSIVAFESHIESFIKE